MPLLARWVVEREAQRIRESLRAFETPAVNATLLCALWGRLGRPPTIAEIEAERTRFVQLYRDTQN